MIERTYKDLLTARYTSRDRAPRTFPRLLFVTEYAFVAQDWAPDPNMPGYYCVIPETEGEFKEWHQRLSGKELKWRSFACGYEKEGPFAYGRIDPTEERTKLIARWGIS